MTHERLRVGLLATHPIQYYAPWYRALAKHVDLHVYFSHRQDARGQAEAGFGVDFDWDVPLLEGYRSTFLTNVAKRPDVGRFWGCNTPEVARVVQGFDAFVVQGWATASYWQAIRACWKSGTPVLVRGDSTLETPRKAWKRLVKEPVYRWFVPRFDGYLVVGTRARGYLLHYGASADRCFTVPHAVDNAFFAARAEESRRHRTQHRARFGLPGDGIVFLFVGKLADDKNPQGFVRAVAQAAARHSGVWGLVIGDGPLRAETERMARSLEAPVKFAGFQNQSQMGTAYTVSDILVVTSRHETWGLVVNEAMACGLPAIVSRGVGCAEDLVLRGETGEIFDVGDDEALAGIIASLAADPDRRRQMSERAVEHIRGFDVSATASSTAEAVRRLVVR